MSKPDETDRQRGRPSDNERPDTVVGLLYEVLKFLGDVCRKSGMLARLLLLVLGVSFGVGVVVAISGKTLDLGTSLGHIDWWKVLGGATGGTMVTVLITRPVRTFRARKAARRQAQEAELRNLGAKIQELNEDLENLRMELKMGSDEAVKKKKKKKKQSK
jgi:hypothetical protein